MRTVRFLFFFATLFGFLSTLHAQKQKPKAKVSAKQDSLVKPPKTPPPKVVIDTVYEEKMDITDTPAWMEKIDTSSPPDDELTAELRKMLTVTGALNIGMQFARDLNNARTQGNDFLPPEFYDRLFTEITQGESRKLFEDAMIKAYRKHLVLEDVKKLNEFYDTPVGKKYLAILPTLLEDAQTAGAGIGAFVGMKVYKQLIKEGIIK